MDVDGHLFQENLRESDQNILLKTDIMFWLKLSRGSTGLEILISWMRKYWSTLRWSCKNKKKAKVSSICQVIHWIANVRGKDQGKSKNWNWTWVKIQKNQKKIVDNLTFSMKFIICLLLQLKLTIKVENWIFKNLP